MRNFKQDDLVKTLFAGKVIWGSVTEYKGDTTFVHWHEPGIISEWPTSRLLMPAEDTEILRSEGFVVILDYGIFGTVFLVEERDDGTPVWGANYVEAILFPDLGEAVDVMVNLKCQYGANIMALAEARKIG